MQRLLCIVSSLNAGGAETFMMKVLRNLPDGYKIDFVTSASSGVYEKEVLELGGKIHRVPLRTKHPLRTFLCIRNVVAQNGYHCVLKLCDTPIGVFDLLAAKAGGAKKLCARSCNASSNEGTIRKIVNTVLRPLFNRITSVKIAPSRLAAEYTFGKKEVENRKVFFLNNGLDLSLFQYSEIARKNIRQELQIPDDVTVYGHIGRFNQQKNHDFLIEVFEKIHQQENDTVFVLVGIGELMQQIKEKVHQKGLDGSVKFLGLRSDIPAILSAMDVFVFPSFYEGMPNTVIEAQATGLPCVIADTITREANITGLVEYLPLGDAEHWAASAKQAMRTVRPDTHKMFYEQHYDIASQTKTFIEYMFEE